MFALLLSLAFSSAVSGPDEHTFLAHMRSHGLLYTGSEYQIRLGIYLAHRHYVTSFNSRSSFSLSLTPLSSLTPAEYRALLGYRRPLAPSPRLAPCARTAPASWDWRAEGVVQSVKDQGGCGAGWAFGAIAAAESMWALHAGDLPSLSEQNLIDCDGSAQGCDGGTFESAYWTVLLQQFGHFSSEQDYPYTGVQGRCAFVSADPYLDSFGSLSEKTEADLLANVYDVGPMAVAIDGSSPTFQLYSAGVYDNPSCSQTDLNHGMVCVGYGSENGVDFWIVKNSWGKAWGESGYIRMIRNKDNQCGIANNAVVPVIL